MKKYIFILVILIIAFPGYAEEVSRIIAKVNNIPIRPRNPLWLIIKYSKHLLMNFSV